jgi:hypothetical protein
MLKFESNKLKLVSATCAFIALSMTTVVGTSTAVAANASLIVVGDMETGDYSEYGWRTSGNAPTISGTESPVCNGDYALSIHLNYDTSETRYRTEITNVVVENGDKHFNLGDEYWIGFAIYLPEYWQIDQDYSDILLQFHGSPDDGEDWRNPPLALLVDVDQWKLRYLADSKPLTENKNYTVSGSENIGTVERGRWTTFVMHINAWYDDGGFIKVWKDGKQVVDYRGGVFFNDIQGPYLKFGNYKTAWKPDSSWGGPSAFSDRLHFFDELRIGDANATYEDVVPRCGEDQTARTVPNSPRNLTAD